jgi:hypothetical protein
MCIIVDNNVVDQVLRGDDPNFHTLREGLHGRSALRIRMAYGGRLRREYERSQALIRLLATLDRAGRAFKVDDREVDSEELRIEQSRLCVSDDPHIIALAFVAKVRLLCSKDEALHSDFTNQRLLDAPRGKVYQDPSHAHLLLTFCV